jgi:hypothetical protein
MIMGVFSFERAAVFMPPLFYFWCPMAYLDSLTQAQTNIGALIVQVTTNPQPNYSVDGESYSWADYLSMLMAQAKVLDEAIQRAGGPFEVSSYGR